MVDTHVLNIFLWTASVCLIVLTLLAAVVSYVALRAAVEIRALVQLANGELQAYRRVRSRIERSGHFAFSWIRAFGRRMTSMNMVSDNKK
jgi:hypothetical protein